MPASSPAVRRAWAVLCLLLTSLVSACGGGGGGGGNSTPPPAPTLSISQRQVSVSAQTGNAAPASISIPFTVANAPSSQLYSGVAQSGDAVAQASAAWQTAGSGTLTVAFFPPAELGAGIYSETVTFNVCIDSACAQPITGAPVTITVNYTVTGSALAPVSFYFPQPITNFQATTSVTSAETATFEFIIQNVPPAGLFLVLTQPQGGFVTGVTDNVEPDSAGNLDVTINFTLVSPASLGSGYFKSSVSTAICYDRACQNPVTGSPVTVPIYYEVFLTEGKEYTLVSSSLGGLSDLAYDSANQQLYVTTLAGYSAGTSGAVVQIDPATGNAIAQQTISDSLSTIALSGDGQLVYAGSKTNSSIYRLTLPALQSDITIPLGSLTTPTGSDPNIAAQIAVAPGAAHTLAVSLAHPTGPNFSQGIAVFDDAAERSQVIAPLGYFASADFIAWGSTASTLFASRYSYQLPQDWEIDALAVDSSGLSVQTAFNLTGGSDTGGLITYDNGNLYESTGIVRNAATGTVLGQIVVPDQTSGSPVVQPSLVTPDSANSRLFALVSDPQSSHLMLFIYALPGFALQSAIDLGYDSFDVNVATRMITWGAQGVAFNRNGLQILSGSFYAPGSGSPAKTGSSAGERPAAVRMPRTIIIPPARSFAR